MGELALLVEEFSLIDCFWSDDLSEIFFKGVLLPFADYDAFEEEEAYEVVLLIAVVEFLPQMAGNHSLELVVESQSFDSGGEGIFQKIAIILIIFLGNDLDFLQFFKVDQIFHF